MAHTKAKGASKLGRDSQSKRLGVKVFGGGKVMPGVIIVRQRGTKWLPGQGVKSGADDSLYAVREGQVAFEKKKVLKFDGKRVTSTIVRVV